MLKAEGKKIIMAEGDFGLSLPITIVGAEIESADNINFKIRKSINGELVLEKNFTNIVDNQFNLSFIKEESDTLKIGYYVYGIDWYRENSFMGNVIKSETFQVEDKV